MMQVIMQDPEWSDNVGLTACFALTDVSKLMHSPRGHIGVVIDF